MSSTEKVFKVLSVFDAATPCLSVSQIAEKAQMDVSAAQRCTHTLETLGYLTRLNGSKQFCLSAQNLFFGQRYLSSQPLVEFATQYMVELNRTFEEMTSLTVLHNDQIIFVSRLPGRQFLNAHITIGYGLPVYCTAPGLAILSGLPAETAGKIIKEADLQKITPHTIVDEERIMRRIAKAAEDRFIVTCEETILGDISVAAPVFSQEGRAVAAINVAVPTVRWTTEKSVSEIAPQVRQAAQAVSIRLGHNPSV